MNVININLTEDEVIVLFEFFERFCDKGKLYFVHPAEYVALLKISAQIDKSTTSLFSADYAQILSKARERIAEGFDSDFPKIGKE